ncbi:hypothetical protein V2W45_1424433 [Cenococcum geophilum]
MWWNSTVAVTVATVITQYLQYNNTVIPKTTTLYNATAMDNIELPSDIIPADLVYTRTYLKLATTLVRTTTM